MFSVFLSSYRNTCQSLGELEKAVETLTCGSCSHSISRSPKLPRPLVFLLNLLNIIFLANPVRSSEELRSGSNVELYMCRT